MGQTIRAFALLLAVVFCVTPVAAQRDAATADEIPALVERMARIGRSYGASFSPDGKYVALISDLSGVPQVWTVPVDGGWPRMATAGEDPVDRVEWSPKSNWLAISVSPGGGLNSQVYVVRPDGTGLRRLTDGGRENNWLGNWTPDGRTLTITSNRRDPAAMDVYLVDAETSGQKLVSRMASGIQQPGRISRDGRRSVLFRMKSRSDNDLYLVDLTTGHETLLTPHEPPATFFGELAPDGRNVYVGYNAGRDLMAFGRVPIAEDGTPGALQLIAEDPAAELGDFRLNHSGTQAALLWNRAGRSQLAFVDLSSGKTSPGPELPSELAGLSEYSPDDRRLTFTLSGSIAPLNVWVLDLQSDQFHQLTYSPHPGVDLDALVRPGLVTYTAHDGLELSGWLYRPQAKAGPTPYVLSFHGGPEGQERPAFRPDYQALVASGIGVFAPNVRGSAGFGKRFVNLDNGPLRTNAIRDIKASVDYLVERGIADPRRLGIAGGSYGGYMTMAGVTEYPDLFAAGANLFGIVNFKTFFEHSEPWMAVISTVEYGDPATQGEMLAGLSPIHKLDRIRAALMVQHGANDTNVPVVEAEQIVEALRQREVPVEYILFPDEGHGFRKTRNRIRSMVEMVQFFRKHLAADETSGSAVRDPAAQLVTVR